MGLGGGMAGWQGREFCTGSRASVRPCAKAANIGPIATGRRVQSA